MGKFYAIKNGRKIGIYSSWDECKKQVDGFKGAIYKGFTSYDDAKKFVGYISDDKSSAEYNENYFDKKDDVVKAYVDGSYSDIYNIYSYGVVIIYNKSIIRFSGKDSRKENITMRNVAGELLGAIEAIKWAINNDIKKICIYHDYEGIEKWANGQWKATKEGTKEYKRFVELARNIIQVSFEKVKAHSGVRYNEEADMLAKSEIIKLEEEKIKYNDNKVNEYKELFNKVMMSNLNTKNQISVIYKNMIITESRLKKVAKEIWKLQNRNIKEIDMINVRLNIEENIVNVDIQDIENNLFSYKILL